MERIEPGPVRSILRLASGKPLTVRLHSAEKDTIPLDGAVYLVQYQGMHVLAVIRSVRRLPEGEEVNRHVEDDSQRSS
jgi:hypothetical protein